MRLWHYGLLPYLPDLQFKGQLRELVVTMRAWRDDGKTNHLLINKVMEYQRNELVNYFLQYKTFYFLRYGKTIDQKDWNEFAMSDDVMIEEIKVECFDGWHNKEYLRVCMANLYEKHHFGVGKSRITDAEWERLCEGYKFITGEEYEI